LRHFKQNQNKTKFRTKNPDKNFTLSDRGISSPNWWQWSLTVNSPKPGQFDGCCGYVNVCACNNQDVHL